MAELIESVRSIISEKPDNALIYAEGLVSEQVEGTNQYLRLLVAGGELAEIYPGLFVKMRQTKYGAVSAYYEAVIPQLAELWQETIVVNGGALANGMGLSKHVPVRPVYWTSGEGRKLNFGGITVCIITVPDYKLLAPHTLHGDVIRALLFQGVGSVQESLKQLREREIATELDIEKIKLLVTKCRSMPDWIKEEIQTWL